MNVGRFMFVILVTILLLSSSFSAYEFKCPRDWLSFKTNCYRFTRSPTRTYDEAKERCSTYNAHLLSVLSTEEHNFVTEWLRHNDPLHQSWYTSAVDTGSNTWRWDVPLGALSSSGVTSGIIQGGVNGNQGGFGQGGDRGGVKNRDFYSIIAAFWLPLSEQNKLNRTLSNSYSGSRPSYDSGPGASSSWSVRSGKHSVYSFSPSMNRWGLVRVDSNEYHGYVCKMKREDVSFANAIERNIDYGINVIDTQKIPRGPKFIHEPDSIVFDVSGKFVGVFPLNQSFILT